MTDSPNGGRGREGGSGGRDQWSSGRDEPTQAYGPPGYTDPAYASQTPYGPPYQAPPPPTRPTERLPAYSGYGSDPYSPGQYGPGGYGEPPPPDGPKSPRWLWVVAGIAVFTAVGLVIALVIVNSSRQDTVLAPVPSAPDPGLSTPPTTSRAPSTTRRTPTSTPQLPLPTLPTLTPPDTTTEGPTDTVVYTVEGSGRVINITYVDNGGLLQTEFNVMLPWSKEVALPQPGESSASISIINVGREVTCSISVNGASVQQRTGAGLTICAPTG